MRIASQEPLFGARSEGTLEGRKGRLGSTDLTHGQASPNTSPGARVGSRTYPPLSTPHGPFPYLPRSTADYDGIEEEDMLNLLNTVRGLSLIHI